MPSETKMRPPPPGENVLSGYIKGKNSWKKRKVLYLFKMACTYITEYSSIKYKSLLSVLRDKTQKVEVFLNWKAHSSVLVSGVLVILTCACKS